LNKPSIDIALAQFSKLTKALIDASSIIFAIKAGFLNSLGKTIQLYTVAEVSVEKSQNYEFIPII